MEAICEDRWSAKGASHRKEITHVAEVGLLDPALDDTSGSLVVVDSQCRRDDGCRDRLCCVNNLSDTRDSERDVHRSDSGEMEGLERHLGSWLSDGLSANGSDGSSCEQLVSHMLREEKMERRTWLDLGPNVLRPAKLQEGANLRLGDLGLVVDDSLLSLCEHIRVSRLAQRASRRRTSSTPERVRRCRELGERRRHAVGDAVLGSRLDNGHVDVEANVGEELRRAGASEVGRGEFVVDELHDLERKESNVRGLELGVLKEPEEDQYGPRFERRGVP